MATVTDCVWMQPFASCTDTVYVPPGRLENSESAWKFVPSSWRQSAKECKRMSITHTEYFKVPEPPVATTLMYPFDELAQVACAVGVIVIAIIHY